MVYSISDEFILIIFGFVESDHACYIEMLENLEVVFWCIASSFEFTNIVKWAHEGDEFVGYDPVQVTILDFFIIFVLLVVKFSELVPS